MDFATCLRDARLHADVSQQQLADRASLDQSYVARLEQGTRQPSRATIAAICQALDLTGPARIDLFASAGFIAYDLSADVAVPS